MGKQVQIAIDPGASGAFAVKDANRRVYTVAMPDEDADVLEAIRDICAHAEIECGGNIVATMERVGGFIAGCPAPGSAMFNFGRGVGFLTGVLMVMRVPLTIITPQKWQSTLQLGTSKAYGSKPEWKRHLRSVAATMYPEQKVTLKNCDALLILRAAYGNVQNS